MKHTPGPWAFAAWSSHGRIICVPEIEKDGTWSQIKTYIGYAQGYPKPDPLSVGMDEATANAQLMAAAPDMLTALEAIEAALRKDSRQKDIVGDEVEYHLDGQTMGWAISEARKAIAKATKQ